MLCNPALQVRMSEVTVGGVPDPLEADRRRPTPQIGAELCPVRGQTEQHVVRAPDGGVGAEPPEVQRDVGHAAFQHSARDLVHASRRPCVVNDDHQITCPNTGRELALKLGLVGGVGQRRAGPVD